MKDTSFPYKFYCKTFPLQHCFKMKIAYALSEWGSISSDRRKKKHLICSKRTCTLMRHLFCVDNNISTGIRISTIINFLGVQYERHKKRESSSWKLYRRCSDGLPTVRKKEKESALRQQKPLSHTNKRFTRRSWRFLVSS